MFNKLTAWARGIRSKWAAISFEKKVSMFVAPIFVAVVTAAVLPRITRSDDGGQVSTEASSERLEVSDLTVNNSSEGTSIDVSLRNTGGLVAVATKARFDILKFATLGACLPEAYLLPTHTYELVLPTEDAQGKSRDVSLSQEIESNDSDRFTFEVGVDDPTLTSTVSYLYRLRVALFHDRKPTPIQAGEVWLAEPFPQEHWFSVPENGDNDPFRQEVETCVDRNRADLSAIYRGSASVSPELLDFAESVGLSR